MGWCTSETPPSALLALLVIDPEKLSVAGSCRSSSGSPGLPRRLPVWSEEWQQRLLSSADGLAHTAAPSNPAGQAQAVRCPQGRSRVGFRALNASHHCIPEFSDLKPRLLR